MKENKLLKLAVRSGEIMLKNGAEAYRIEDTMKRILQTKYKEVEAVATTTSINASVEDEQNQILTFVKRVHSRTIHLTKVSLVNDLSRQFTSNNISLEQALENLEIIDSTPSYPIKVTIPVTIITCFCFCLMFGGNVNDSLVAGITGGVLAIVKNKISNYQTTSILSNLIGGAVVAIVVKLLLSVGIGDNIDYIVSGSIMPLVPGICFTNALRDIIEGDYLSGIGRFFEALMIGTGIAVGVGIIFMIGGIF